MSAPVATGWTVDTLHSHLVGIMDEREKRAVELAKAQKEALDAALAAKDKAVDKSEADAQKWRDNANEWRAAMTDKDKLYMTKEMADSQFASLNKRLDLYEGSRTGMVQLWGFIVGAIGLVSVLLMIAFNFSHVVK